MAKVDFAWTAARGYNIRGELARQQVRRKDLRLLKIELTGRGE
jgi:hypothetical protein